MAKRILVTLIDDFDGTSTADETVTFSIDGLGYEIDLSNEHSEQLRAVFSDWITHARKASGAKRRSAAPKQRAATERQESAAARQWARAQGLQVSARGRISAEILAAYHAAGH